MTDARKRRNGAAMVPKHEKLHGTRKREHGDTTPIAQPQGAGAQGTENSRQTRMPHERDESASTTGNRMDQDPPPSEAQISDAVDDLQAGREDTDLRGVPDDIPTPRQQKR